MKQALLASFIVLAVFGTFVTIVYRTADRPTLVDRILEQAPTPDEMYPPSPKRMPAATATPLRELLDEYEKVLIGCGIDIAKNLQPGLSDEQLDELEKQHDVKLSADIRDLYKWHNGSTFESLRIFPLGRFLPLEESLKSRVKLGPPDKQTDPRMQEYFETLMAHRFSWIQITDNLSGDGYFYDPKRIDDTSSFFYKSHDDVGYDFYPSVGNFIEQLLAENKMHPFKKDEYGITFDSGSWNYEQETQLINKFGQRVE